MQKRIEKAALSVSGVKSQIGIWTVVRFIVNEKTDVTTIQKRLLL
jgi:hypothetical protein